MQRFGRTITLSLGTVNSSLRTFRTQRFTEMERDCTERSHTTQKRAARTLQCHLEAGGVDPLVRKAENFAVDFRHRISAR